MKPIRRILYQSVLYVAIPLIVSLLIGYLAKCSLLIPASIIYGVLLVFMIPSDSFLSSNFLFVLTALVLCLLLLLVG